ncbi:MAG TPA: bacteriohopanetetrol glucosamine biosynthesis glycosyltransferase HpnI [Terriglobales bacterium]|nr:bacteriohopanetetrol glucosamine biosynthesis glycosyltransferase HpnI [Terriglobales bacterium]
MSDSSTLMHSILKVLEIIAAGGAVSAIGYYAACLISAWSFSRERDLQEKDETRRSGGWMPLVSILKPLKGVDPHLYEALRSHCLQEYPDYEIIFGVSEPDDPALEIVRRLQIEFPSTHMQVVVCRQKLGTNTKVSNLAQMLPAARHEYLIVNDSDILVPADYLARVMAPLSEPNVGVVTCLYRGIAAPTLGSRLEALGISTDFCPGVLVARWLERGLRFGLGSTLAFRRRDLEAIGGFESFVDYLADDYELAGRIAALGRQIHLSEIVLQTSLAAYSVREFVKHQLRWARGIRHCRPGGYAGLVFTFGVPWGLAGVAFSAAAAWTWELLLITLASRLAVAVVVGRKLLRDDQVPGLLWLVPLRDIFAVFIWIVSFAGRTVAWRGDQFYLKNGKLVRIGPEISG